MAGARPLLPEGSDVGSGAGRARADIGVAVSAAGRLHLGFLDPSATLGRRFGSLGMMIEDAETVVHLASSDVQRVSAGVEARHELERAGRIVARLQQASGRHDPVSVHLVTALPAHVGLGSGTQLALALGRAFSELHGLGLTTGAVANLLGRGNRSGIGLAGFDHGGVLVDGGHRCGDEPAADGKSEEPIAGGKGGGPIADEKGRKSNADEKGRKSNADEKGRKSNADEKGRSRAVADAQAGGQEADAWLDGVLVNDLRIASRYSSQDNSRNDLPPLLARCDFPDKWRVILVQDPARTGLHGADERLGLARLPEFARDKAAHLCHLVLLRILPALAEQEFAPFADGVSELQRLVGNYFAPVQGGVFSSPAVGRLISWISEHHVAATGQSSWGPTAFAILPSADEATHVVTAARSAGVLEAGLEVKIVAGRNNGASIRRCSDPAHAGR